MFLAKDKTVTTMLHIAVRNQWKEHDRVCMSTNRDENLENTFILIRIWTKKIKSYSLKKEDVH